MFKPEMNQTSPEKILYRLSEELSDTYEENESCQKVVQILHESCDYSFMALYLFDGETRVWMLAAETEWAMEPVNSQILQSSELIERSLLNGNLLYTPDVSESPGFGIFPQDSGSEIDIPVWIGEEVLGVLIAGAKKTDGFNQNDFDLLTAVARQIGITIWNARLKSSILKANQIAETLRSAHLALSQSLDMNVLCETLLDSFQKLISYDSATIFLLEGEKRLQAKAVRGYENWVDDTNEAMMVNFEFEPGNVVHTIINTKEGTIIPNTKEFAGWVTFPSSVHILSMLGVPMLAGGKVIGVCCLDSARVNAFDENQVELALTLATQAAFAIENAYLFDELNKAKDSAEAANESKSAFVANVSHELRTPLTSILGFTKIIKKRLINRILPQIDQKDRKNQRAFDNTIEELGIIISEGERLTTLINDLLDLSKIEAGKLEWHMRPLDITEMIDRAFTSTSTLFKEKEIELIKDIQPHLPEVVGDEDRLVQVMINLLSNAAKFTGAGSVTCRANQIFDDVRICVIDTGTGIEKSEQGRVFEKFTQVSDTLVGKPSGTGLGLPICKQIVEYHGGRIWVESEPGLGSTFLFTLPGKQ